MLRDRLGVTPERAFGGGCSLFVLFYLIAIALFIWFLDFLFGLELVQMFFDKISKVYSLWVTS